MIELHNNNGCSREHMWTVEFVHVLSLCLTSYNNYLFTDSRFLIEHGTLHQYYIFNFSLYLPPFD